MSVAARTVLVVDDQAAVRTALEFLFDVHGLAVASVASPREAIARVERGDIGVVVQDMNFARDTTSGEEGAQLFRKLRAIDPELPIILMTAWASLPTAVALVREGALDYMQKPWDDARLVEIVRRQLAVRAGVPLRTSDRAQLERRELAERYDLCGLVYASDAIHKLVSLAVQVAPTDAPVLVTGPNGSGKEKIAEILHANSARRERPLVKVNVGALPDSLMEAELFGAEAGAFTGASRARVGRFEAADGGTLVLDEMGNLSASGQMKLLRVLQSGEFERLGSSVTRVADVRVVSATNANLSRAIAEGTFREDLYFRLNVIELRVPALRERVEDILPLAEHFLRDGPAEARLSDAARASLCEHSWPGNVRELRNRIERAKLVAQGPTIVPADLDLEVPPSSPEPRSSPPSSEPRAPMKSEPIIDRAGLEELLGRTEGNVSRAAAELGMSRQALYRRMERLGVSLDRKRNE
jgi:DNA-binding NtrC family response regulator